MSDLLTLCHDHANASGRMDYHLSVIQKQLDALTKVAGQIVFTDIRDALSKVKEERKLMNSVVDHYYDRASKYTQE